MNAQTLTFSLLCGAALLLVVGFVGHPWWTERQRQRVRQTAFPAKWRKILRRRVPLIQRMPVDLQLQLKKHIQVFIAERAFIGCGGLRMTDEIRVVIAAQACLLLLNRKTDFYPNLRQILVYPAAFWVDRAHTDGSGVQQEQRRALAGESWQQGQVILSWQDSLDGAAVVDDGRNVVIHEFAHQLDQENGPANGDPARGHNPPPYSTQRWSQVFHAAFAQLQHEAATGQVGLLNHYGAQDPAEFFAVVSEVFFEQPQALQAQLPDLYRELVGFYQVDPAAW